MGGVSWWVSWSHGAPFLVLLLVLVLVLLSLPMSVAGAGAVVISPSQPPSKLHPLSTLQAVVHRHGVGAGSSFITVVMPGEGGGGLA